MEIVLQRGSSCCSLEMLLCRNNWNFICIEMLIGGAARVQVRDPCSLTLLVARAILLSAEFYARGAQ